MLIVTNTEHMEVVKAFAEKHGLSDKLDAQLEYLDNYGCTVQEYEDGLKYVDPTRCIVLLGKDFAPQSFTVTWLFRKKDTEPVTPERARELYELRRLDEHYAFYMNGGCIFFGPNESGFGAPQFSVQLTPSAEANWSIHT